MTPFIVTLIVAGIAALLWFLGRQLGNQTVTDAGFIVGVLNTPLLAFLLRGALTLALALGLLMASAQETRAAGTLYVGASCGPYATCHVVFYGYGGSDNYDCWTVRLYHSVGHMVDSLCGFSGWKVVTFQLYSNAHRANVAGIWYNDGVGSAYTECHPWG